MTLKYGLQVWDTQAFSVLVQNSSAGILDLIDTNEQRARLQQKSCSPTKNTLAFAADLQELAEMLSGVYPWMKSYLQDLTQEFQQQSTAVLTINVPEQPSKFTILAYFVMMLARRHHMVIYNAAGDFYILPVQEKVLTSRFPELYKNNIRDIPGDAHIQFMKIYRQALIAEGLAQHDDLIDWDQYSMRDDDCDVKASKMAVERVKAYLTKIGTEFGFDEDRKIFTIPIKNLGDIEFELIFKVWAVMMERGVGRIGIRHYLSVKHENALQNNSFLQNVNKKFEICFGENIQQLSILAIFDLFDYREKLASLYSGSRIYPNIIFEHNTWSDLFLQIERLRSDSIEVLSDIYHVDDFLKLIEEGLGNRVTMKDLTIFRMNESLCVCYLMYAKLFRRSLFSILVDEFRKIYMNLKSKEEIFHLIDYIQNYELTT